MNQKKLVLDKINGFTISILLLGNYISTQIVYIRDMKNINDKIIVIVIILSLTFLFYWKYLKSKNIFYDILLFFSLICVYYLYVKFYINSFPIFLFLLLFLLIYIFYKKGIKNKNYLFLFLIFFIMMVMVNIIIFGITNGEYSIIKYKYFLIYSMLPCFYIIFVANNANLEWCKKFMWYICLFFLICSVEYYYKRNAMFGQEVMNLTINYISASFIYGSIFLYIFFEKIIFQKKNIYITLLPLLLFFMLLSGSRGPLISLLMTVAIYFIININIKNIIFAIIILVFAFFFINSNNYNLLVTKYKGFNRINYTIGDYFEGGMKMDLLSAGREVLYSKAIKDFYKKPFGIGVGTNETRGNYPHNSFLEIASQLGIIVLFIYLSIIFIWFIQFYKSEKKALFKYRIFKYLFIYILVQSLFSGSIFINPAFWIALTINGVVFCIESKKSQYQA